LGPPRDFLVGTARSLAQQLQRSRTELHELAAGRFPLQETVAAQLLDQAADRLQITLPKRALAKELRQSGRIAADLGVVEHQLVGGCGRGIVAARKARAEQAVRSKAAHLRIF